jgi:hypothetical protein
MAFIERHFTAVLLALLTLISLAVTVWLMTGRAVDRTDLAWAQAITGGFASGLLLSLNASRSESKPPNPSNSSNPPDPTK